MFVRAYVWRVEALYVFFTLNMSSVYTCFVSLDICSYGSYLVNLYNIGYLISSSFPSPSQHVAAASSRVSLPLPPLRPFYSIFPPY